MAVRGVRTVRAAAVVAALLLPVSVPGHGHEAPRPGPVVVTASPTALTNPADPFRAGLVPAPDADARGMFTAQLDWPLIPIHAALLPDGHLVTYGTPLGRAEQGGLAYDDWSPTDGSHTGTPSTTAYNSFCNGLQALPDGRLIMVGGDTTTSTMVYDPATHSQDAGPDLNRQRWYATALRLPDDRILVLGGADAHHTEAYRNPLHDSGVAVVPEIGDGRGDWSLLIGAGSRTAFGAERNRWWYPRAYVAGDGSVFGMSDDRMWRLDVDGPGRVTELGTLPVRPGVSGSSVMVEPGRILVAGGGQAANTDAVTGTEHAVVVDISGPPRVEPTAPMAYRRNWGNLTVLSDGRVLANGGTVVGTGPGAGNSSSTAEIWDPATGSWIPAATAARIRTYHSTSVLLPSGAVFTGGGGLPGPEDNLNAEVYYPPSLFERAADGRVTWADRPAITSIAGDLRYGGTLRLGLADDRRIASASLIRLGLVTHSVNADQRRVPVPVDQDGAAASVQLPDAPGLLPPGGYLLQVVDDEGVPSPSQTVTITADRSPGTVTATRDQGGRAGFWEPVRDTNRN
ncbi:MAG: DUF1929 domain-containing protein [Actinomycetota bacterium]|nr:DUF1929 domain-containing protein [Actinomycetota bacterium]